MSPSARRPDRLRDRRRARRAEARPDELGGAGATLERRDRAVVAAAAVPDRVGRVVAGALTAATIGSAALRRGSHRDTRETLDFYVEAAASGRADVLFRAPTAVPDVLRRRVTPGRRHPDVAVLEQVRFRSGYVPANPATRPLFSAYRRNAWAWAQHWRHGDRPRPTIVLVHGFFVSPWALNASFFHVPLLYERGYDVMLTTLPFHGRRRERTSPYSGSGLLSHGVAHTVEAVAQGVYDIRSSIGWLLDRGTPAVGVTGVSLGGYTAALLAETEPRLAFAIPNSPPTDLADTARLWSPNEALLHAVLPRVGLDPELFWAVMRSHSPLAYDPVLPRDRLMIVAGLGDRMVLPGQVLRLWEHWERPRLEWHRGNHMVHVGQQHYAREIAGFLEGIGFADGLPAGRAGTGPRDGGGRLSRWRSSAASG